MGRTAALPTIAKSGELIARYGFAFLHASAVLSGRIDLLSRCLGFKASVNLILPGICENLFQERNLLFARSFSVVNREILTEGARPLYG
jgi:hypothetical protein